nr:PREDICTED: uncharacterized protein LOC100876432 isoform X1 [Megachile rotundata]
MYKQRLVLAMMWMMLASGLQGVASVSADDAATQQEASDEGQGIPQFDGKLPTPQQLLDMLDSMTGLSEEEKATLREDLLKNIQQQGTDLPAGGNNLTVQTMILLSLLALVALIFVFFVYKLFKCLSERQMKREEKKKNKQMKKKK